MVSKERFGKLKIIIKEEYGRNLSDNEVSEIGNQIGGHYKGLMKLKVDQLSRNKNKL